MINSREIDDLIPELQILCNKFKQICSCIGIEITIISTYRDLEQQAILYAQGRTAPGNIVTNAKPGQSYHNFRRAFDFVPIDEYGTAIWNNQELFNQCGTIGKYLGLTWGGDFNNIKDFGHFEYPQGYSLEELNNQS